MDIDTPDIKCQVVAPEIEHPQPDMINDTNSEMGQSQPTPDQPKSSAVGRPTASTDLFASILDAIEEFDSSIPDPVVCHFLNCAGLQTNDRRIVRLIAVAAQKFIHDIVSDSLQHCKLRATQGKKGKDKKYTLAIEDLSSALSEYGIEVKRQQYFN